MLSIDVSLIFTNVPIVETVDVMSGFIAQHDIPLGITLVDMNEMLLKCTQNIEFQLNQKTDHQNDGVGIGSP